MVSNPIRVLIVDDSALIRSLLTEIISSDKRMEVVGAAHDPYDARNMIKSLNPDVLTLDIEMPKMNGITFLKNIMRLRPMPVVMISTLTQSGAPATLEALELGAVDFLGKPKGDSDGLADYKDVIIEKVFHAASAKIYHRDIATRQKKQLISPVKGKKLRRNFICAIGASTGGTEAIQDVLIDLPEQSPPIVIAQHIPAMFSTSFAQRLNKNCAITVYEAQHGQPIQEGCAYLAPGSQHLVVAKKPTGEYICQLTDTEPVNRHKPSVEVLFHSVVEKAQKNAIGVLLTGMGADGAEGLLSMRDGGCVTVAQDEQTSVVWGMPRAAVELGAANEVLPLGKIGEFIMRTAYQ